MQPLENIKQKISHKIFVINLHLTCRRKAILMNLVKQHPEYPYKDIIDGAIGPSRTPLQQIYMKDTAYDDEFVKLGEVSQICTI
jgi:hypothetical protein